MKSKLILLVVFLVLVISGCNDVMNYDKTILKQETIVGSCSLSSDATEYSIKATDKILLTIADCEGNEIYYNSKIQVQMYNDGEWDDVEYHGGPTEQLTIIPDQETGQVSGNYAIPMKNFGGDVQKGIYKLTLTVMDEPMSVIVLFGD